MLTFANQAASRTLVATTTVLCVIMFAVGGMLHAKVLSTATPESVRVGQGADPHKPGLTDSELDTDQDGLSDFHETCKYLTSPNNADTDGDGIPDGDWLERREYQYTVRSVVQVLRPVTIEFLNDHFQDARVLDETDDYVELEVVHYPFNRVDSSIKANDNWRDEASSMQQWTQPGPSSDWDPEMREQLKQALRKDGIDVDKLNDRQVVEKVSRWLCERAEYVDGFTTFVTAWDESGKPFIPEGLDGAAERELARSGLTIEQQWEREVSARGMFQHKTRGSCTSSAIYLNGCLKAVGIPTRTVLCIPLIDASDEREFDLVMNIQNPAVRQHLFRSLRPLKQSWASHTFNEVFVGGQWHRLNYSNLGQGIYDRQLFGMITHVATFNDWADAKAHETIGKRQKTDGPRDVFGFRNPYSTISLRDEVGVHCQVELPEVQEEGGHLVENIYWTDDEKLPEGIRENCRRRGRFGFIAELTGAGSMQEFLDFLENADLRVFMNPQGDGNHPQLKIGFDKGCFWVNDNKAYIYVPFGGGDRRDLVKGVEYSFQPRDDSIKKGWQLKKELKAIRTRDIPK